MKRSWAWLAAGIILGWCSHWAVAGRYEVIAAEKFVILLDRWSGRTWATLSDWGWHRMPEG